MYPPLAVGAMEVTLGVAAVALLTILIAITLRLRKAALHYEDRFRGLVDAVPEYAIFMLDAEGRVATWNAGARRIMGYSEKEILGRHFSAFFTGEDVDLKKPEEELHFATSLGKFEHTGFHLRKDGSRFWADVAIAVTKDPHGRTTGFSKVIRDSTERKRAQDALAAAAADLDRRVQERSAELLDTNRLLRQEVDRRSQTEASLRQSEAVARGMFDTAVDAIVTIDSRGLIATFNSAAQRLFGYDANDVIGRNVSILMPQPYRAEHDSYLARYQGTHEKKIIGIGREVVAQRKDGTTFPIDLAVGEQYVDGRVIFTGFIRDITERKRLEAEILQIAEREQQRIGQDLHDSLGQLLTGVSFLVKALESQLSAKQLPEAEQLVKVGALLTQAVSQARALSRGLQPLDDPQELAIAIEHLCESIREVFQINCTLKMDSADVAQISDLVIATHIYRIVQEAVNNAIRHGKAKQINVTLQNLGNALAFSIEDDGIGFGIHRGSGIGIRTMSYRAKTIGAAIKIEPRSTGGVIVSCILPIMAK